VAVIVASPALAEPQPPSAQRTRASVASWLGVLLVMLFTLNTIGGWVRLSGAGVAIPQWPVVNGSLLPPLSDQGWSEVKAAYDADQARLSERVRQGELSAGNLGRSPRDLGEFKGMFLTEWSHRLFSALVGVMAAGCLTIVMREQGLRRLIGVPMGAAGVLIPLQAVLGGLIIATGTNTHWLFLHQGNAALIMALVLLSTLRLLHAGAPPLRAAEAGRRRLLITISAITLVVAWLQLVAGGLVAGSRNGSSFEEWPLASAGRLWIASHGWAWNLLDNAWLHQWLHRWLAWTLVAALALLTLVSWRAAMPLRYRLALRVALTFMGVQALLGVANVLTGITPAVSLAHQFMGMCLVMSLVLAWFDAQHEHSVEDAHRDAPELATPESPRPAAGLR
jgi:cytochrome c oxidase assembly protein subunit 15